MKVNLFYGLIVSVLTISNVFGKTTFLNRACDSNAEYLGNGDAPNGKNNMTLFAAYLEKTDEDISLRLDCDKMKLFAVSEFYGSHESEDVIKISSKNINFQYDQTTKEVSFNVFNQKVIATLNSRDFVFEEQVAEEVGKEVNDEVVRHEYKDKIVVFKDYFDGLVSIDISEDGKTRNFDIRDVAFNLTDLLYPEVNFLHNGNVGIHQLSYGQQGDYKLVLKELSGL